MLLFTSPGEDEKRMVDNFRPLQPIMDRTVRSSFSSKHRMILETESEQQTHQRMPLKGSMHL